MANMGHKMGDFVKLHAWAKVAPSNEGLVLVDNLAGGSVEAACVASAIIKQKDEHKLHSGAQNVEDMIKSDCVP
jgi:hypothetical protein